MSECLFLNYRVDMDKKTIDLVFNGDSVSVAGEYDVNGRILLLPIRGNGHLNITFGMETHLLL